jgi:Domain of unknown function (DUF4419)
MQFSFYVNSKADLLRDKFVDFQGMKTLLVPDEWNSSHRGSRDSTQSYGGPPNCQENQKDADVVDCLLPAFSTATKFDRVAASVSIMSTLQAFFDCWFRLCCGIPQFTLEGTVQDWENLRNNADRLPT